MNAALPRLTARSVVLSAMLGLHPAWATSGELFKLTAGFGVKDTALRVALSRMVGAGDLIRSADGYQLSERLLARQRRQDDAMRPAQRIWRGSWLVTVITSVGTDPRTRANLRSVLHNNRFAELREGVWMRPDNLDVHLPKDVRARIRLLQSYDDTPAELARKLWDLPAWAQTARRLLDQLASASDVLEEFVVAAAMVRHLLTDPVLPDALLPCAWPGDELRAVYAEYAADLGDRRYRVDPVPAI